MQMQKTISVLNGVLWDMRLAHCGICEIDLYTNTNLNVLLESTDYDF